METKETKPCEQCGQVFERPYGRVDAEWKRRRFCSTQCRDAWRRGRTFAQHAHDILVCEACNQSFEAGGRSKARRDSRFCSRRCAAAARWRTGSEAQHLNVPDAAYLAGLIDGEGSIFLYKSDARSMAMRITVANTYKPILEWCQQITGVGNIVMTNRENTKHKSGGMWLANSQAAASILEQIRPYLKIKHEQADIAIDFQQKLKIPAEKALKEWQAEYRQRLKDMNARGPTRGTQFDLTLET